MPDDNLALVNGIADNGGLIVGFTNGTWHGIVEDETGVVRVGDVVRVEPLSYGSDEYRAVAVVKEGGWDSGNPVAVVEQVFDDTMMVRTEEQEMTVDRPDVDVDEGYTIELTRANTFRRVLDMEPAEIGSSTEVNVNMPGEDEIQEADLFQADRIGDVSFDDVIGLWSAKERLKEAVALPMEQPEKIKEFDLDDQFGILFYGPPGTGKTMLAKAAANEWELSDLFFHIGGPEIVSKYYGESERQIRDVFDAAERKAAEAEKPAVVFIDELDSIVPRRDRADETERRIVAQFLSELDGLEDRGDIIVIGATNLIEVIDPAVRRPGRFDEQIEFTLPDHGERIEILRVHSEDMPVGEDVDFERAAQQTEGWSGADLKSIVKKTGFIAVKEDRSAVGQEDLTIAIERYESQRREKQAQFQNEEEQG
jgi:transitional endoplasmic reticulum ATPase